MHSIYVMANNRFDYAQLPYNNNLWVDHLKKIIILSIEPQLLHNFFLLFTYCLSVPFYDIISANNVESEQDIEFGQHEIQNTIDDNDFDTSGEKSRKEKILQDGKPTQLNKEKPSYEGEGRYSRTLLYINSYSMNRRSLKQW